MVQLPCRIFDDWWWSRMMQLFGKLHHLLSNWCRSPITAVLFQRLMANHLSKTSCTSFLGVGLGPRKRLDWRSWICKEEATSLGITFTTEKTRMSIRWGKYLVVYRANWRILILETSWCTQCTLYIRKKKYIYIYLNTELYKLLHTTFGNRASKNKSHGVCRICGFLKLEQWKTHEVFCRNRGLYCSV